MKQVLSCVTLVQHLKQPGCPFQRPFARAPPTHDVDVEDSLKNLKAFILKKIQGSNPRFNLTHDEAVVLKSLREKRDLFHFLGSDKGGEFVMMEKELHKQLTMHLLTSAGVYQFVVPTRKRNGVYKNTQVPGIRHHQQF